MAVTVPSKISVPSITPLAGVLLDVATITESVNYLEPEGLFDSYNCLVTDREATWPCPAVPLDEPVQTASTTNAAGGTIPADTYFSTITALSGTGETLESNEVSVATTGATSTITFNWNTVTGATGYRIYVTDGASGSEKFLIEITGGAENDYTWTGTPAIGTTDPPSEANAILHDSKAFSAPAWVDGVRFAVYAGLLCKPYGFEMDEGLAEARRVFTARESVGVERALMETLLQGATDLTPGGGPVAPEVGLAILEGDAATAYAGVPTIHAPRSIGSLLMTRTAAHAEGGAFYTEQGAKLASGGGYNATNLSPAGVAPAAGTLWMYATGEVSVARGSVTANNPINQYSNEIHVLVERPYVAAIDCYKSAVRVTVS
jgi:hypothetical protein